MREEAFNGNWKTAAAIFAVVISAGSAVALHFNGIQSANDYTDKRIQEIVPVLKDIEKLLFTINSKVVVIEEKVVTQERREEKRR